MDVSPPGDPPAVSVIIPTYERREYVCRAVRSVLAQRFTDWELIVVDDGSTDGTEEALRAFGPRLRYLWQENRGVSSARNAGLRVARSKIVAFLDSDDRWLPDHLETVVAMLDRHPEAVLASTCLGYHIGGKQGVSHARVIDALPSLCSTLGLAGYTPSIAVRRETLVAVGGFDERLKVAEDHHLWLRLAGRGRFCFVKRRTLVRQRTVGSLIEQGIRGGAYVKSFQLIAEAGAAQAERHPYLAGRARGMLEYVAALHALARGDDDAFRVAICAAHRDLPELSSQPDEVANRITRISGGSIRRRRNFATAAALWPDPRAHTALFLRAKALALALRALRLQEALELVAQWPLRPTPGFALRNMPLWGRLLRRAAQDRLYRGRESLRAAPTAPTAETMTGGSRGS